MTKETYKENMLLFLKAARQFKIGKNKEEEKETLDVYYKFLKDMPDIEFTFAINKVINNVTEIYPTTNFVSLVRDQIKKYPDQVKKLYPQPEQKVIAPTAEQIEENKVDVAKFIDSLKTIPQPGKQKTSQREQISSENEQAELILKIEEIAKTMDTEEFLKIKEGAEITTTLTLCSVDELKFLWRILINVKKV